MAKKILNDPVLVLNKHWAPVRIINVIRAVKAAARGRALILDSDYQAYEWCNEFKKLSWINLPTDGHKSIKTTSGSIRAPEVIILTSYDKIPKHAVRLNKKNVYIRDGGVCQYSGEKLRLNEASLDHIIPRSRGGDNDWKNVVLCSKKVNNKKGDQTPKEAGLDLASTPKTPVWSPLYTAIATLPAVPDSWEPFLTHLKD